MTDGYAVYEEDGGRATVSFSRDLDAAPAAVWAALTEPSELAHWFPEGAEPDEITEREDGRLLGFTAGREILRWTLDPSGEAGTRLHLSQLLSSPSHAARDAAGWHVCLDRLAAHLSGVSTRPPGPEPTPEWEAHFGEYAGRGFPSETRPAA